MKAYLFLHCIANLFNWFSGYCHRYDGKWRVLWSTSFQAEKNAYFDAPRLRDAKRRWQRCHRRCWKRTCLSYYSYISAHPPQVCIVGIRDGFISIVAVFLVQRTQKSISETELAELRQRSQTTTTYLQIPPRQTAPQLTRQRSQPIQPRPSGTTLSPASGNASSTTPPPPQSMNIPTLAVTPVSSAPNIVIEHYPTIIRLVSIEEMNTGTDPPPSTIPTLTRASSCTGKIEIILMVKTW